MTNRLGAIAGIKVAGVVEPDAARASWLFTQFVEDMGHCTPESAAGHSQKRPRSRRV